MVVVRGGGGGGGGGFGDDGFAGATVVVGNSTAGLGTVTEAAVVGLVVVGLDVAAAVDAVAAVVPGRPTVGVVRGAGGVSKPPTSSRRNPVAAATPPAGRDVNQAHLARPRTAAARPIPNRGRPSMTRNAPKPTAIPLMRNTSQTAPTPTRNSHVPAALGASSIHSCHSGGAAGQDGSGCHPCGGCHPFGGVGQFGAGLKRRVTIDHRRSGIDRAAVTTANTVNISGPGAGVTAYADRGGSGMPPRGGSTAGLTDPVVGLQTRRRAPGRFLVPGWRREDRRSSSPGHPVMIAAPKTGVTRRPIRGQDTEPPPPGPMLNAGPAGAGAAGTQNPGQVTSGGVVYEAAPRDPLWSLGGQLLGGHGVVGRVGGGEEV